MVVFALLGAWHVHTQSFIEAALKTGKAELKLVWDTDKQRGQAAADQFGVPFEPDLQKVFRNHEITAVMVECETTKHKKVIVEAARAKKHIFTDKALALTREDCAEIKQAVENNQVQFMISMEAKTIGAYQYAKQLVDSGKLGKITSVYFRRVHQGALDRDMLPEYWFDVSQTGGGATADLGCHGLYLLPYFCGNPKKVTSLMNHWSGAGTDDLSTTIIEFESGAIGTAHTSFTASCLDNMLEIVGTEGILVIAGAGNPDYHVMLQSQHFPGHETLAPVASGHLPAEDLLPSAQFIQMLSSGKKSFHQEFNLEKAEALTNLINCAYESATQGKTVLYR